MNIVVTLDAGYIPQLKVMLHSLMRHHPQEQVDVYILHSRLTPQDFDEIARPLPAECVLHSVAVRDEMLRSAPVSGRYPREMYYRLFAAQLLPPTVNRALYLDPDTVINGSLHELYDMDLGGCCYAAATHVREALRRINALRLCARGLESYVNSGVLLMDLAALRADDRTGDIARFIEENQNRLLLPDQDIISVLYGGRIAQLDAFRYNMTERLFVLRPDSEAFLNLDWVRKNAAVIHYCGRNKPWKTRYRGKLGVFYHEAAALCERAQRGK